VAVLADVPQESNAVVMARAVEVVRANRITREYVAASAADSILSGVLAIAPPEELKAALLARAPNLIREFRADMEASGMLWEVAPSARANDGI
jgi:hypothetical protein